MLKNKLWIALLFLLISIPVYCNSGEIDRILPSTNIEFYVMQTSTLNATLLIPTKAQRTYFELHEIANKGNLYWYNTTFTTTTINPTVSTNVTTGVPYYISRDSYTSPSVQCYNGDIYVLSTGATTTVIGLQTWR